MMRSGKALPLPAIACGVCGHPERRCRVAAAIRASCTVSNQRSGRGVGKCPTLFDTILADTGIRVILTGVGMPRIDAVMER